MGLGLERSKLEGGSSLSASTFWSAASFRAVSRDTFVELLTMRGGVVDSLIKTFARFLPDMKATFSIFDQPQIYLSWGRRGSLVELGLRGERASFHLL